HHHLHPFPPRRSSDLAHPRRRSPPVPGSPGPTVRPAASSTGRPSPRPSPRLPVPGPARRSVAPYVSLFFLDRLSARDRPAPAARSEEHTSELQSRGQL